MSRVFTIFVILALMAVVALVPQMGKEKPLEQGPDLGEGYAYKPDTLRRFRLLIEDPAWSLADPPRNPRGMLEAVHEKTGLTFVLIPAGSFLMGSPSSEPLRDDDEQVRSVGVRKSFLLCKTECSQDAWRRGGRKHSCQFVDASLPVEMVNWRESRNWCRRNGFRLPSEAEWEYACRAGTKTPFSVGWELSTDQANYEGSLPYAGGRTGEQRERTVAAGSLPPNPWGLHEMHGNVGEWCEDWYGPSLAAPSDGSPQISRGEAVHRVFRGGHWQRSAWRCRSAARGNTHPRLHLPFLGFRPARDLPDWASTTPR